jgi:hypothetical protein
MNPSQYWVQLVNSTMASNGISYNEAWLMAGRIQPEACTLMRAFGQTLQSVNFFNSRVESAQPRKASARAEFHQKVDARMKAAKCDYDTAFNYVSRHHAELANAAGGPGKAESYAKSDTAPVFGPQLKTIFRLPVFATQEECSAAWKGNGNSPAPFNPGKVFAALCELQQVKAGCSYEAALKTCKTLYPNLWQAVQEISDSKL